MECTTISKDLIKEDFLKTITEDFQNEKTSPEDFQKKEAEDFLRTISEITSDNFIICYFGEKREFAKYRADKKFTLDHSVNIYYTVNPRKKLNETHNGTLKGQGTKENISEVIAFFADVEAGQEGHQKDVFYNSKDEALKGIRSFKYQPSYIIDSGHGYHCLWLFKEPYVLGEDVDLEYYESLNRGIQKALNADDTSDVSRILRLPGSFNVKDPDNPKLCKVIEKTDIYYNLDDFETYITPIYDNSSYSSDLNLDLKFVDVNRRRLSPRINGIISNGIDKENPSNTDRSRLIQSVVVAMVEKNYSDEEIYTVLTDRNLKISEKILTEKNTDKKRKRYIALSIDKAKKYLEEEKNETINEAKNKFEVLGHNKDHKVVFWKNGVIQKFELKRLAKEDLCLLTGLDTIEKRQFHQIKKHIIHECNVKGFIKDETISNGVWKKDNEFIVISGEDILRVKDNAINRLKHPVIDNKIVEFREKWLDFEIFSDVFQEASIADVYQELYEYIDQWKWKDPEMISYMTSFFMLAPFQQAMIWRPWIYLQGKAGSGKTHFFINTFQAIYGNLVMRLDNSSFAGAAQELSGTSEIALFDNFEANNKTQKFLELFQSSNRREGKVTRGTPSGKSKTFGLHHLLFLSGVAPANKATAASDSRTIIFKLEQFTDDNSPASVIPVNKAELLKAKILASMIKNWDLIEGKATRYRRKYSKRTADNLAYAMAIQEIISEKEIEEFPEFVTQRNVVNDEVKLLDTILRSLVVEDNIQEISVNKKPAFAILLNGGDIQSKGLKKITKKDGTEYLVLNTRVVGRYLLKDTEYENSYNLDDILLNLPGAKKEHQRMQGNNLYLVIIPWKFVEAYSQVG